MIRKTLLLAAALLALLVPVAHAQYAGNDGSARIGPNGELIVQGRGLVPNANVNWNARYRAFSDENAVGFIGGYEGEIAFGAPAAPEWTVVASGTAQADAQGNVEFSVPTSAGDGEYEITMTDGVNTIVVSQTVGSSGGGNVAAPAGGGALPRTGDDTTSTLAQFGAAAVALGAVAVYGAKRRKAKAFA